MASGIKKDGNKKFFANYEIRKLRDSRIRRDDCINIFYCSLDSFRTLQFEDSK